MLRPGIRRFFRLSSMEDVERDVSDELTTHFEERVELLVRRGLSREAAREEAERRFGGATGRAALREAAFERDRRLSVHGWIDDFVRDLRYSWRSLLQERGFSMMVVVTFALGIGANAAMFGLLDRLLLSGPPHVVAPDGLMRAYRAQSDGAGGESVTSTSSYAQYQMLRDIGFGGAAAYEVAERPIGRGVDAKLMQVVNATADYFPLLGVRPALGRFFTSAEDRPGDSRNVAVISYELWQGSFGGTTAVIGESIVIRDQVYTIVGVTPAGFAGVDLRQIAAWIPVSATADAGTDWTQQWGSKWLEIVVRMPDGVMPAAAAERATTAFRAAYNFRDRLEAQSRIFFAPLHHNAQGEESTQVAVSRWLFGIAFLVLCIACANVANLQLARAVKRRREVAVRLALGISRIRLIRLFLLQSVLLAVIGGLLAIAVAHWGGALIHAVLMPEFPIAGSPVSLRVLLYTAAISFAVGIGTGVLPALQGSIRGSDLSSTLRAGARALGGGGVRARNALTIAQAALSVLLLIGAGLFVRSLFNVRSMDLGFDAQEVLAIAIPWPDFEHLSENESNAEEQRRRVAVTEIERAVRALPGVERASLAQYSPLYSTMRAEIRATGWDSIPDLAGGGPYLSAVTPEYFETVDTELIRGRAFTEADLASSDRVAVINQTMAATLWPNQNPLEKCLYIGRGNVPCHRVVGVAEDTHRFELREQPAMQYYIPHGQERAIDGSWRLMKDRGSDGPTLMVRTREATQALRAQLRAEVQRALPGDGYIDISRLEDVLAPQVQPWRMGAALFGLFGVLALTIAAVGLYSVMAYLVISRRTELGMRRALGALTVDLLKLIVLRGLALASTGIAIGVTVAWFGAERLQPLLFDSSPRDPVVFGGAVAILLLCAVSACLLPAWRASRVDPALVLRAD